MVGIYKITAPDGEFYIGQSKNIEKRWDAHIKCKADQTPKLAASFFKHGANNHIFEVVEECVETDLLEREGFYIDTLNACSSLNCSKSKSNLPKQKRSFQEHLKNELMKNPALVIQKRKEKQERAIKRALKDKQMRLKRAKFAK